MQKRNTSKRFLELDALRGIAAIFVVFFHFTMFRVEADYGFGLGVTGVDLFFIISGFVILMTLEKTITWQQFVISRFSRLFPTYWTCVSFTTLLIFIWYIWLGKEKIYIQWLANEESVSGLLAQYLANLTMFQLYFRVPDIDGPYWTMLVEMLFYLYMLVIFIAKKIKHIEKIGALTLLPIILYSTPYFGQHFALAHKLLEKGLPLINYFPLFLAGILFYKIKFNGFSWRRSWLLGACYLCQLSLFDDGIKANIYLDFMSYFFMLTIYFTLFILYVNGFLGFIVNQVTIFLGEISFSLYLIHQYVSIAILLPVLLQDYGLNFWLASGLNLVVVVLLAFWINRFIEKPAMNFIRHKYKAKNSTSRPLPTPQKALVLPNIAKQYS